MKKIIVGLIIFLIFIQLFSPQKNEESLESISLFLEETQPSKSIENTLNSACYDCHSNHTNYPWYNNITPVNFWISNHINEGKKYLNFSEWKSYNNNQKAHAFEELIDEVTQRKMPLKTYLLQHPEAVLSKEKIEEIVIWSKQVKEQYK